LFILIKESGNLFGFYFNTWGREDKVYPHIKEIPAPFGVIDFYKMYYFYDINDAEIEKILDPD